MSICVLGMAEEFKDKIAFNALWPRTAIATSAVQYELGGDQSMRRSRTVDIMSDALYYIINTKFSNCTGN